MATLTLADVMKAGRGEGSRGGRIIGHTKSGKPVYANRNASHSSYHNFTNADHEDAGNFHQAEVFRLTDEWNAANDDGHRAKADRLGKQIDRHDARSDSHFARID